MNQTMNAHIIEEPEHYTVVALSVMVYFLLTCMSSVWSCCFTSDDKQMALRDELYELRIQHSRCHIKIAALERDLKYLLHALVMLEKKD